MGCLLPAAPGFAERGEADPRSLVAHRGKFACFGKDNNPLEGVFSVINRIRNQREAIFPGQKL